jgi:mannose-1-phosphate guanylyltransferase
MSDRAHLYSLLLAGGKGTRFWPLSREDHPKQLLRLFSDRTLVEETYDRVGPLVAPGHTLVATALSLGPKLTAVFPDIPRGNFVFEPVARNTLPCIAVAARLCVDRDPDAVIMVLPSDHFVADRPTFLDIMEAAASHAARGEIVTLGITPTHPETGYGYIRFGEFEHATDHPECRYRCRHIQAFVEKPDQATALSYLKAGRYLWNSGIFVFRADVILSKVRLHQPALADAVEALHALSPEERDGEAGLRLWTAMPDISIDYGIMEKAEGIVVIPSSFGWSDVGSWRALSAFPTDEHENFTFGQVLPIDSHGNVLFSSHGVLATLGLKNTVVVVTKGAVLACPIESSQNVRALVDELRRKGLSHLL